VVVDQREGFQLGHPGDHKVQGRDPGITQRYPPAHCTPQFQSLGRRGEQKRDSEEKEEEEEEEEEDEDAGRVLKRVGLQHAKQLGVGMLPEVVHALTTAETLSIYSLKEEDHKGAQVTGTMLEQLMHPVFTQPRREKSHVCVVGGGESPSWKNAEKTEHEGNATMRPIRT
jgi:hypothetical protein